jgi:hypothetical protein
MRHAAVIALCCLVAAGVASTASPGGSRSDTTLDLCAVRSSIQEAVVARTNAFPGNGLRFTFPAHVSITSRLRARTLASAVCGLPPLPTPAPKCPADLGVTYLVRFLGPNLRVSIRPYGCEVVSGAGPDRWAAPSPGFWRTLGRQMGMPTATLKTFQGRKS